MEIIKNIVIIYFLCVTIFLNANSHQFDSFLALHILSKENIACGKSFGKITVSATQGIPDYTYQWSNGQKGRTATNLSVGTYTVTATDASGATASLSVTIEEGTGDALQANIQSPSKISCATKQVTLNASNSSTGSNISYQWTTQIGNIISGETTLNPVIDKKGSYNLLIQNTDTGCEISKTISVEEESSNELVFSNISHINCNGEISGGVTVEVNGTSQNNIFNWSNGSTQAIQNNLVAGKYIVTVTIGECELIDSIEITESPALELIISSTPASETSTNDGQLSVSVDGGKSPYKYQWSNNVEQSTNNNLLPGNYTLTVTDANDCVLIRSVELLEKCQVEQNCQSDLPSIGAIPYSVVADYCDNPVQNTEGAINFERTDLNYFIQEIPYNSGDPIPAGDVQVQITKSGSRDTVINVTIPNNFFSIKETYLIPATCEKPNELVVIKEGGNPDLPDMLVAFRNPPFHLNLSGENTLSDTLRIIDIPSGTYSISALADVNTENNCGESFSYIVPLVSEMIVELTKEETICQNQTYNFYNQSLHTSGTYTHKIETSNQCDTLVTLNLTVAPFIEKTITATIKAGETFQYGSTAYVDAGIYTEMLPASEGCDTLLTLELIEEKKEIVLSIPNVLSAEVGENIVVPIIVTNFKDVATFQFTTSWDNSKYQLSEVSSPSLNGSTSPLIGTNTPGSVLITHAVDDPNNLLNLDDGDTLLLIDIVPLHCNSTDSIKISGDITPIEITGPSSVFPVSIHNGFIKVESPVLSSSFQATICEGKTYRFGTQNLDRAGNYQEIYSTSNGCDSTVNLQLSINPFKRRTITASLCDVSSFTYSGNVYTNAGQYTLTKNAPSGCDSIITINLIQEVDLGNMAIIYTGSEDCLQNNESTLNIAVTGGSDNHTFKWSDNELGRQRTVKYPGNYTVEVGNQNECAEVMEISILPCTTATTTALYGFIENFKASMIAGVNIIPENTISENQTGDDGYYLVAANKNQTLSITVNKEDTHLRGVTAADIVLILRHLVHLELFTNPNQILAADVNGDGRVSAFDAAKLFDLLLQRIDKIEGVPAWRFYDKKHQFSDISNPFLDPIPEKIVVEMEDNAPLQLDLMGFKIGDVNATATVNSLQQSEARSNMPVGLSLRLPDLKLKKGNSYRIPIKIDAEDLLGFQLSIRLINDYVQFSHLEYPKDSPYNENNFGLNQIHKGYINFAEYDFNKHSGVAFYINLLATKDGSIKEALTLSNDLLELESYTSNMAYRSIGLNIESDKIDKYELILFQNKPNPFTKKTFIEFELPQRSTITLNILDINGKIIKSMQGSFEEGRNSFSLDRSKLEAGIYFYQIETNLGKAINRMVIL